MRFCRLDDDAGSKTPSLSSKLWKICVERRDVESDAKVLRRLVAQVKSSSAVAASKPDQFLHKLVQKMELDLKS